MHEFSLADEVIRIAVEEAEKNSAVSVKEITIEVGCMNGIDPDAFELALGILADGSVLEKADYKIIRTRGKGFCLECNIEFEMNNRMDTCPRCNSFPSWIRGGDDFRVISMVIMEEEDLKGL